MARSLVPHLEGRAGHDEVIGEYLAEGALAPIVMIRRGRYKFIHSPADPDQLYDVESDPDELANLAGEAKAGAIVAAFPRRRGRPAGISRRWTRRCARASAGAVSSIRP